MDKVVWVTMHAHAFQQLFEMRAAEVREMNSNEEDIERSIVTLIELQHVLDKTQIMLAQVNEYCEIILLSTLFGDSNLSVSLSGTKES